MNDINQDQSADEHDPAQYLIQLEQTNREMSQQIADCTLQLGLVKTTLQEAQRIIDQNRQLETERNALLAQERDLNELKSNFVTLASHEFRTPMMTILSSASLIARYNGDTDRENRERHIQRIKEAVTSLTTMLNDFLAINQMDQQVMNSQLLNLNLVTLCQEVMTDAKVIIKPGQCLHYDHFGDEVTITADGQAIKTILLNLLSNASKYSAEDTEIHMTSTIQPGLLTLTVSDQGIGVPDVDKDKLFINFFRARNAIHIQGTGLGLYLVKRYVDLLGGSITFTSQVGVGTVFTVQLPIADTNV